MELELENELGSITIETTETAKPIAVNIISHGAGAGMHHPFLVDLANRLTERDVTTIRFNFPYMEAGRKSPGSPTKNIAAWAQVVTHVTGQHPGLPIFVSGKSYGGRMASHLLTENTFESVRGIIYYGFPLHAPGRDSKDRADHLNQIGIPQLFLQGTRDKLANIDMIQEVVDSLPLATIEKIESGDHSFNVPKSKMSRSEVLDLLASESVSFIKKVV